MRGLVWSGLVTLLRSLVTRARGWAERKRTPKLLAGRGSEAAVCGCAGLGCLTAVCVLSPGRGYTYTFDRKEAFVTTLCHNEVGGRRKSTKPIKNKSKRNQ